jgi:hypothetical protein
MASGAHGFERDRPDEMVLSVENAQMAGLGSPGLTVSQGNVPRWIQTKRVPFHGDSLSKKSHHHHLVGIRSVVGNRSHTPVQMRQLVELGKLRELGGKPRIVEGMERILILQLGNH